jgi:putative Mg2+ transporter-C (MgtC) family protein
MTLVFGMSALEAELGSRLLIAAVLGAAIGLEREYHAHPAGLRTLIMVAMGACLFTMMGPLLIQPGSKIGDPTRIAAQVVTGIGFLGGGAILRTQDRVQGMTTASTIWAVAALGMAVGFGFYALAIFGTFLGLVALVGIRPLEEWLFNILPAPRPRKRRKPATQTRKGDEAGD